VKTTEATSGVPAGPRPASRDQITRILLEDGPCTTTTLAERLGLTPAAVRRHLDALLAAGVIEAREAAIAGARGRGRPAKLFALTDRGRATFNQAYDDLALGALRFLAASGGEEAVRAFAQARVADIEDRYRPLLEMIEPAQRPTALAEALRADGYAASTRKGAAATGEQLCQHHCPVSHVAEQFPQLCEAETEAFGRLLGTHVQRLATIAHGDGVCTTYVPQPDPRESAQERTHG
jgi:predicted ArsR family transcriptional regulator